MIASRGSFVRETYFNSADVYAIGDNFSPTKEREFVYLRARARQDKWKKIDSHSATSACKAAVGNMIGEILRMNTGSERLLLLVVRAAYSFKHSGSLEIRWRPNPSASAFWFTTTLTCSLFHSYSSSNPDILCKHKY